MAIDFPNNPTAGQTYSYNGLNWQYNGVAWDKIISGSSGGIASNNFTEGSTAPTPVYAGDRWFDIDDGNLYTAITDDSGLIWVQLNAGIIGPTGATGPQGNTGATGPVGDYVISIRGLTGSVGLTNGSGIGLNVSGQTMTFSNTGVLSIDGGTGAITNVARTNVANVFTESQTIVTSPAVFTINDTGSLKEFILDPDNNVLAFGDFGNYLNLSFPSLLSSSETITFPNFTTTLAGLSGTQTFTGINTFNALTNFPGGISAAGATFSSLVRFNAGISAAGGTFGGNVQSATYTETSNGIRVTNNARSWFL